MELKTKYQYTYFLHPFMVKENRYLRYILKLLKNPNCKLKIFQKEKDLGIYTYFIPKIRNYMFSTFTFSKAKIKKFQELSVDTKAAVLAKCLVQCSNILFQEIFKVKQMEAKEYFLQYKK